MDLLLEFSDREVPQADGLYIGLTKPQLLSQNFQELILDSQKPEGGSQETAYPAWSTLQNLATGAREEVGNLSSEINLSEV
jgi:hypothetical protein